MAIDYDLIIIGTGTATSLIDPFLREHPDGRIAVIDRNTPGGICLTRGCIPSKLLLYPAELLHMMTQGKEFGIDATINEVDFRGIMQAMRDNIGEDIENIRQGLQEAEQIDYYREVARFIEPYTLEVGEETITGDMIVLCTGSKPAIPPIEGIDSVAFHTSSTLLDLEERPDSLVIVGGGYIAAEYGFFFSLMGTKVTIVGRNPQFLPDEEPEISAVAQHKLMEHLDIVTNHEVRSMSQGDDEVTIIAVNRDDGSEVSFKASEVLIATGRAPETDILQPEKGGIEVDEHGWITVGEHLQTSQSNVWALGDATGRYLFKHVANHEVEVVYHNALLDKDMAVDYHAVPHAVFTSPEIAAVGMREDEAVEEYGDDGILIGFYRYENTGKGDAMHARDYFVKVILEREELYILGAHIVGPMASVLIQEIVNLMYTPERQVYPLLQAMHIHPALPEVVQRACSNLMTREQYHHQLEHH
ncbi:MAG: dihydrolipoyl dehydrogenase [Thermoplasmatota archaeon]